MFKLITVALIILCSPLSFAQSENSVAGFILNTYGKVVIERQGKSLKGVRKLALKIGDNISTDSKSRAKIKFNDGTITTLGADTTMVIDQYSWTPENKGKAEFNLLSGAFRTITGKILDKPGSHFKVKTAAGSMGIRGTDFWGGSLGDKDIHVLLIDGHHAVEVSNNKGTVLLEKPGQGTTLWADQSPLKVLVWPDTKVKRAFDTVAWPEN